MARKPRNDVAAPKDVHARLSPEENAAVDRALAVWKQRLAPRAFSRSDMIRVGLKAAVEGVSETWPAPETKVS